MQSFLSMQFMYNPSNPPNPPNPPYPRCEWVALGCCARAALPWPSRTLILARNRASRRSRGSHQVYALRASALSCHRCWRSMRTSSSCTTSLVCSGPALRERARAAVRALEQRRGRWCSRTRVPTPATGVRDASSRGAAAGLRAYLSIRST